MRMSTSFITTKLHVIKTIMYKHVYIIIILICLTFVLCILMNELQLSSLTPWPFILHIFLECIIILLTDM